MRIFIITFISLVVLFCGFKFLQTIKFDAAVSISVAKGPFKGINFKLMDYKISMNDLNYKHEFWDSDLGKAVFEQLSSTMQTIVKAGSEYVSVEVDVNYFGMFKRHYSIHEEIARIGFAA